ncbi:MAG: hypothetical protein AAGE80_05625 [Pseudomonadota bacterium]
MSFAPGGTEDDFYGPDWRDHAVDAGWLDPRDYSLGAFDILMERQRQETEEGWSAEHDDKHIRGEMATVAAIYAHTDRDRFDALRAFWPATWDEKWHKPKTRREDLVRAGALIAAEIDRLDRAEKQERDELHRAEMEELQHQEEQRELERVEMEEHFRRNPHG